MSNDKTADRLRSILHKPGPYLTAYLNVIETSPADAWFGLRPEVESRNVDAPLIEAVDAGVRLPTEDDIGGWGIVVASDGSTEVFTSPDAPRRSIVNMSPVPYLAPALEWDQRDVGHVVVVANVDAIEVIPFVSGERSDVRTIWTDAESAIRSIDELVAENDVRLVVCAGDDATARTIARSLRGQLPPSLVIRVLPDDETGSLDDFADAVVRHASTVQAVDTVETLQQFRFERSHGSVAEGVTDVINALREAPVRTLLVHDDPDDQRSIAMSPDQPVWSIGEPRIAGEEAFAVRLVDAAIAAALVAGADVHIIPTTGENGPADDVGVIVDDDDPAPSKAAGDEVERRSFGDARADELARAALFGAVPPPPA